MLFVKRTVPAGRFSYCEKGHYFTLRPFSFTINTVHFLGDFVLYEADGTGGILEYIAYPRIIKLEMTTFDTQNNQS